MALTALLCVSLVDGFVTSTTQRALLHGQNTHQQSKWRRSPRARATLNPPRRTRLVQTSLHYHLLNINPKLAIGAMIASITAEILNFNPTMAISALSASITAKFLSRWRTYCMVPLTAAIVGYVTNWLAVKMSESHSTISDESLRHSSHTVIASC